jgi:sugar porter (SP) family MFS transporter
MRPLHRWALAAAMGGFTFGYQVGVVSGALLAIRVDFGLNAFQQGMMVSALPLAAIAGGLLSGRLADALGRRATLMIAAAVFLVGTGLAVAAPGYGALVVSRAIAGVGVGVVSSVVPLYLSEIAPVAVRGRLVTLQQLMITLGILVSYCVDLVFTSSGSWRAMFAVGLAPAALLFVGMLRSPETPAWLDTRGETERARQVLCQVADADEAERQLADLRRARADQSRQVRASELLRSAARPALVVGLTLAAVQQLSGINAIVAYAPSIMEQAGLSGSGALRSAVLIGALNVAATIVSVRLVDRLGRRPLLLGSLAGMVVSLTVLGLLFAGGLDSSTSWLALVALLLYIAAFAIGLGPIFWLLIAEIFPREARAAGAGVSTAMTWLGNFVVGLMFLPVASAIGEGPTFWIFAGVSLLALVFVARCVPETKGRTFTEIDAELRRRLSAARGALSLEERPLKP